MLVPVLPLLPEVPVLFLLVAVALEVAGVEVVVVSAPQGVTSC